MIDKVSRKADVHFLVSKLLKRGDGLEKLYQRSLEAQEFLELEYETKIYLADAQSILDYCAHDIAAHYGIQQSHKTAFPIVYKTETMNPQGYEGEVEKKLKKLKVVGSEVFYFLGSIQPYNEGYLWMGELAKLNNEHKHVRLVPQIRSEVPSIYIEDAIQMTGRETVISLVGSGSTITIDDKVIYGDQELSPLSENIKSNLPLDIRKTVWVSFRLENSDIDPMQLINKIKGNVPEIVGKIYKFLE